MKTVILHGHLRKFGERFRLDVKSPAEAVRALCVLCKGFRQHVEKNSKPGYHVFCGEFDRGEEELALPTKEETIEIVPVVAGSGAVARIIIGVILIIWGGPFSSLGWGLVIGGAAELLFGSAKSSGSTEENKPSYIFSGAQNTTGQGNAIPVLYGRLEVGGQVISAGVFSEEIAI